MVAPLPPAFSFPGQESEAATRRLRIDPKLTAAGWTPTNYDPSKPLSTYTAHALREYPTANGPADYALILNGRLIAILEAKRVTWSPDSVLTQAERYAAGLPSDSRPPFLYATNGERIRFLDTRHPLNPSRDLAAFHTPTALKELLQRDTQSELTKLQALPNNHRDLRPYQREASEAIELNLADRKRHMLVAMATGTGKTFTLVNQIYRLLRSGAARRVLFLVDRRALAAQAVGAFASFQTGTGRTFAETYPVYSQRLRPDDLDDPSFNPNEMEQHRVENPDPDFPFVYVCTVQRMAMYLFEGAAEAFRSAHSTGPHAEAAEDEDPHRWNIPIHAFDVVVADECHRGYTAATASLWRETLEYFDAVKLGLTATPAAHTTAYFKDVVYRYDYSRAVAEGYLVDYDVVAIHSDVRLNGLFLKEGEQVHLVDPETGQLKLDVLEDERPFDAAEIEQKVTSPDSNRRILQEVKQHAEAHEREFGRFPKTLIFAVNDQGHRSHANSLVRIGTEVFNRGDHFVAKITGKVDRPLQRIREFRNLKQPAVAVTVDLLSTGIDIVDLEYIVFLRPIKSRILFEQMLGRGTRKSRTLFPPKSHFTIFDCFGGSLIRYFRQTTAITAEPPLEPSRTIAQIVQFIANNQERDYNANSLAKRLHRIDRQMDAEARRLFSSYVPDGDLARYAAGLRHQLNRDLTGTLKLLQDASFQDLLLRYPRARDPFYVAATTQDKVSSEVLIRDGTGREYRPEDYLAAFARFVKDNSDQVAAIDILLRRPKDWNPRALEDLRQKLTATPERFDEDRLRRAHELRYGKPLVEIISMIKRAAREDERLYSTAERIDRAFATVCAGQTFTVDQEGWLGAIRSHLIANLAIDRDDFDSFLPFQRRGGWKAALSHFPNLPTLITQLNEAIAA